MLRRKKKTDRLKKVAVSIGRTLGRAESTARSARKRVEKARKGVAKTRKRIGKVAQKAGGELRRRAKR